MNNIKVKFSRNNNTDFIQTVRARVQEYFVANNISRYGNSKMIFKTIVMLSLYFVPYLLMITGIISNPLLIYFMWVIMGVGMAGIGLSIMHDAIHGTYSKSSKVNKWMGSLIYLIGGNAMNWKIQHNILHHSYTNVDGLDEDINPGKILRFSPHTKRYKIHRFQHIYAWFLYGFLTLSWSTTKDYLQLFKFKKKGLTKKQGKFGKLITELLFWKIVYYTLIIVLPFVLLPVSWWVILISIVSMHFVAGLILSAVFQPAHVMPTSEFPVPDKKGSMENSWAVHQLLTTSNFAPSSRLFSWFIGGLNFQVEHHLFPNICHVHYKNISNIVKKTAAEFDLPYYSQENFIKALWYHARMLRQLGQRELA